MFLGWITSLALLDFAHLSSKGAGQKWINNKNLKLLKTEDETQTVLWSEDSESANINAAMELEQCRVTLVTSGIQAMLSCFMIFVIHISEIWWLTKALSGIGVMNSYPDIGIDAEAILLEFANRETHNEVQIGRKNISHFSHLAFWLSVTAAWFVLAAVCICYRHF